MWVAQTTRPYSWHWGLSPVLIKSEILMATLKVNKKTVLYRDSKSGNGVNLLIDGSFVYMDRAIFEEKMADDTISHIIVGDAKPIVDDKGVDTGRTSRSIIEFVISEKARLEEMKSLGDIAKTIDPETAALLASLGISM